MVVECCLNDASELAMRMANRVHGAYYAFFRYARLTQIDQNVELPISVFVLARNNALGPTIKRGVSHEYYLREVEALV